MTIYDHYIIIEITIKVHFTSPPPTSLSSGCSFLMPMEKTKHSYEISIIN